MHYNFVRIDKTLKYTSVVAAGSFDMLRDMEWMRRNDRRARASTQKRGPYKKRQPAYSNWDTTLEAGLLAANLWMWYPVAVGRAHIEMR